MNIPALPQQCRWHLYPDSASLYERACQIILRNAQQAIAHNGEFRIVLAGGSTPRAVYEQLRYAESNWRHWRIYFGDERCLPADHAERNSAMARSVWLRHVKIPAKHIHPMPAEKGPDTGATKYTELLRETGPFDLVLLGLGEDGHTAILRMKYFSNATLAQCTQRPVLNQVTLRGGICGSAMNAAPLSPSRRGRMRSRSPSNRRVAGEFGVDVAHDGRDHRLDHVAGFGRTGWYRRRFDRRDGDAHAGGVDVRILRAALVFVDQHEATRIAQAFDLATGSTPLKPGSSIECLKGSSCCL